MKKFAKLLRKHGLKVTRVRLMVLKTMVGSRRSFSASEMEAQFGHQEDRVTIYRIFSDLHARRIIERFVDIDGVARYVHHPNHAAFHPNFRCRSCGIVQGLPELPDSYLKAIHKHQVEEAVLLFSGTCRNCLKKWAVKT